MLFIMSLLNQTRSSTKSIDVPLRIIGSALVITAYFVVLHVNVILGVTLHFVADLISIPYFVRNVWL